MTVFEFILAVILAVCGVLAGWASLMMSSAPPDFRAARLCLYTAFALVLGLDVFWGFMTETAFGLRALVVGTVGAVMSVGMVEALRWVGKKESAQPMHQQGVGGAGGAAKVGGSGSAIGGPGGSAGQYGIGGVGGSAEVSGDGIAAGGAGGSVGQQGIWKAPAKSGYEIAQRKLGLPIDPFLRQFGRGGAGAGYEPKLAVVEALRQEYFGARAEKPKSIFEDIRAVPLDFINRKLADRDETWRVRIVDDEYEFFSTK